MKALIIGAGIAGPVTAMALRHVGVDAVVHEAYDGRDDDVGSYLTVATNGLDAFQAIGARDLVTGAGFPTATNVLLSHRGKRLGQVSNGGQRADGTVSHTVRRSRLYRALRDTAVERGVEVQFGKRLIGADTAPGGGVVASFSDGTTARGDLVIGADGVHSTVRRIIDPSAPSPRYAGLVNFGGYTPDVAPPDAARGTWYMIFGRRAFFGYTVDPHGGTVWFANLPRPATTPEERASTTPAQWTQQLLRVFADDRGPAVDLIRRGELQLAGDNTHDLPSIPTWHRDAMVVIGDAAHAPTPSSGQGASLAAEDAVVLARCLRDLPEVPQALTAYEQLRRERVERIVANGARTSSTKTPGPLGRVLRDLALPLVFKLFVTDRATAWIHDHHLDWDAPVTTSGGPLR